MVRSSCRDHVLVKRIDVMLLCCPIFHSIVNPDHRPVRVRVTLDKHKVRIAGYWKLNASFFGEQDFQEQQLKKLQRELSLVVVGNKWRDNLKSTIWSLAAYYSQRVNLVTNENGM